VAGEVPPQGAKAEDEAPPVRARGLVKRYKEVLAVDHIDLNVRTGDVYGFLGPNGAGKTTTLRMALGLIVPTEGTVELFGRDPMRVGARALEGVAGFVEAPRFYPYLSARKNLELLAALDGNGAKQRIGEVLGIVELTPRAGHRVGGFSHGMRQRLGIAAALLRRPRLLMLDEPATGLDPAGMRDMRDLIRRLADEGITVLLSSHQLPEVQELCDRVAIVDRGRVVYEGALADLRRQGGAGYRLRSTDDARALALLRAQPGIEHATQGAQGLMFQAQESDVGALSLALAQTGIGILALTPELATLEDLFFRLTES
jgi:ABC-2 type transport system ATP-binding protein